MLDKPLTLNDFSSYIQLIIGLLFVLSGIKEVKELIKNRVKELIEKDIKNTYKSFRQQFAMDLKLLDLSIVEKTEDKRLHKWIKSYILGDEKIQELSNFYLERLEIAFLKVSVIGSMVSTFGTLVLLINGFSNSNSTFYLSYVSIKVCNISYLTLLFFSFFNLLFIFTIITLNGARVNRIFGSSITQVFVKNTILSFLFFALSFVLSFSIYFNISPSSFVIIQNCSIITVILLITISYPYFVISTVTRYTVIIKTYHKCLERYLIFTQEDTERPVDIRINKEGKILYWQTLIQIVKFNNRKKDFNFNFNIGNIIAFCTAYKRQVQIILSSFILIIISVFILIIYKNKFESNVSSTIVEANLLQKNVFEGVHKYSLKEVSSKLSKFYSKNGDAYSSIIDIVQRRKKDSLQLRLDKKSIFNSKNFKIVYKKMSNDTLYVNTHEYWMLLWANPRKTNMILRYVSDTTKQQKYTLYFDRGWKIISNEYYGKLDTLYTK